MNTEWINYVPSETKQEQKIRERENVRMLHRRNRALNIMYSELTKQQRLILIAGLFNCTQVEAAHKLDVWNMR